MNSLFSKKNSQNVTLFEFLLFLILFPFILVYLLLSGILSSFIKNPKEIDNKIGNVNKELEPTLKPENVITTLDIFFDLLRYKNIHYYIKEDQITKLYISAKLKTIIESIDEIEDEIKSGQISVVEIDISDKWLTIINYNIEIEEEVIEASHLVHEFDREEICDPDLLETWDQEAWTFHGESGLNHYMSHGYFSDDGNSFDNNYQTSIWSKYIISDVNDYPRFNSKLMRAFDRINITIYFETLEDVPF